MQNGRAGSSYQSSVVSNQLSVTSEAPAPVVKPENRPTVKPELPIAKSPNHEITQSPNQPMLSDFGLYKCPLCGKMVMGYEKEKHQSEVHKGQVVQWRRLK